MTTETMTTKTMTTEKMTTKTATTSKKSLSDPITNVSKVAEKINKTCQNVIFIIKDTFKGRVYLIFVSLSIDFWIKFICIKLKMMESVNFRSTVKARNENISGFKPT